MQQKALADALAGVVATLVSLWTFYPIDAYKTMLQAGTEDDNDKDNINATGTKKQRIENINQRRTVASLFRGIRIKTIHAASSSFCYFYLYSWIVSYWTAQKTAMKGSQQPPKMTPVVRLALSAVAAMLNTLLTLPLDVLASQQQVKMGTKSNCELACQDQEEKEDLELEETETGDSDSNFEDSRRPLLDNSQLPQVSLDDSTLTMDRVWRELERSDTAPTMIDSMDGSNHSDIFHDTMEEATEGETCSPEDSPQDQQEEKKSDEEDSTRHSESTRRSSCLKVTIHSHDASAPSNRPSIIKKLRFQSPPHYSYSSEGEFEMNQKMKTKNQTSVSANDDSLQSIASLWKGLRPSLLLCSNPSIHYTVFDMAKTRLLQHRSVGSNLSMLEAFMLGLVAKFCATIATYPLIRAKVMLMVLDTKQTHDGSMVTTLLRLLQHDGVVHGWYKGCSVQLLHTVLKSALLMMVKERIARTTHRLLVPPQPRTATRSAEG